MEERLFQVHHIHCEGCESRLRAVLSRRDGVVRAVPSHRTQTVEVEFDPARTTEGAVRRAIEEAGFEVRP